MHPSCKPSPGRSRALNRGFGQMQLAARSRAQCRLELLTLCACSGVLRILVARYRSPCVSTQDVMWFVSLRILRTKYKISGKKKTPRDKPSLKSIVWSHSAGNSIRSPPPRTISYDWPQPDRLFTKRGISAEFQYGAARSMGLTRERPVGKSKR